MTNQHSQNKILSRRESPRSCGARAKKFYFGCVGCLLVIFISLSTVVSAQFELPTIGGIKPAIILNSDPITPLPNSTVAVTANLSGVTGAGGSNYVWFLNGARQTEASGLNKNIFAFRTGAIGAIYRVNINVTTPSGENLSDTINLTVSDVDLTWIANSQAPIFYRAKLMPTQNSFVTISALTFVYRPGTKTPISSNNLVYNWIIDGKMDLKKSGQNKFSYSFWTSNFPGNPYAVRLEVKTENGSVFLNKHMVIPVVKPQVLLYFSDLKTVLPFGAALKNLTTKQTSLNFIAQTYFFSAPIKKLKWQWFINNTKVNGENERPWLATLNLADNFSGRLSAKIQVTAQNPDNELEIAESTTNLEIK